MKLQKQIILWDGLMVLLSGSGVHAFALNIPENKAYDFLLAIFMMDMQIDGNESFKMIVGLMTIVVFFEKQILRIIFWNDIKTYGVWKHIVGFLTLLGILCLCKILKKRSGLFNYLKKLDDNFWYISFVIYLMTDFVLELYVNKFVWVIVTMIAFLLFILAIYYGLKHKKHDEKTS